MTNRIAHNPFPAERVQSILLANGLRVLLLPDRTSDVVAIVTKVNAGYFDEPDDLSGIAHVLEHMFFKGTTRRGVGSIAKETKASGGYLNAHTIYDNTTYYTVLPSSGLFAGLDIQADAFANSLIDSDELERELEVIIEEAKRKADNPYAVASETMYDLLHDAHRIRRWRIGREEGLRKLTREKVLGFYRNFYKPSNTILTVVGNFEVDRVGREIDRLYGGLAAGETQRVPGPKEGGASSFRYREISGDIAQTHVVMGWRTEQLLHEDTPAMDFASAILAMGRASRLYRAVRERKLAASITSHNYTPLELGVFTLHSDGEPGTSTAAAGAMWTEISRMRNELPDESEMMRVRNLFESQLMRRLETMEGKANHLADWEGLGDWRLGAKYFEDFMAVTRNDVRRVTSRYLRPERASVLVYRPSGAPTVASGADEMLHLLHERASPRVDSLAATAHPRVKLNGAVDSQGGESGVHVFRSERGVPILIGCKPDSDIVYLQVQAVGGSSLETMKVAGVSMLAARATAKGTAAYSAEQVSAMSEEMGGSISVSAGRDSITWSFSVPAHSLEEGIALLADVVQNASISEEAVETERHVALSNLANLSDDMYAYPVRLATLAAFAGHPYGVPANGTEESLHALSGSAVREWYRERLANSEWTIGIVGNVNPETTARLSSSAFSQLEQRERVPIPPVNWPKSSPVVAESRDKAQTAVALAFAGPGRRDPARYAAGLIAAVASGLGGRFFDELRDKQSLAYTVHAQTACYPAGGIFLSYIATSPEKESAARKGLLEQFARLVSERVTAEELDRAREYTLGSHSMRQESGATVLVDLISAWTFGGGLSEIGEFAGRIRTVEADDMREVARRYFLAERRVEGIVRGTGRAV